MNAPLTYAAWSYAWRRFNFGAAQRARTWRLVADLVDAKLDLPEALETAASVARDGGQAAVAALIMDLRTGVQYGDLDQRVARYTSGAEALLFRVIGSAGAAGVLRGAMRLAEQQDRLGRAIKGALAMPALLTALMGVVFYMLGSELFPALIDVAPLERWSPAARAIGNFSLWFVGNFQWVLIGLAAVFMFLRLFLPRYAGPGRVFLDKFLPCSLYRLQVGTGFIFTVTELGRMGETLNSQLLHELGTGTRGYLKSRIHAIAVQLTARGWGEALKATGHDFPARDLNAVMAALDGKDDWVETFAGFLDRWLEELDTRVKVQTRIMNMALMGAVAGAIGATVSSTLSVLQSIQ